MADTKNIYQRLLVVQQTAKAPREISGKFGKARSAEQIEEAYKPVCNDNGLYLYTSDEMRQVGDRNYVVATATVVDVETKETHSASASAWENVVELSKSGSAILDTSQVTGKTSSYAKKYALQNLFAIDDTKDADNDHDYQPPAPRATAPASKGGDEELARAKTVINEELESQDYNRPDQKKTFINSVIKQDSIDNIDQANEVMDALENQRGA